LVEINAHIAEIVLERNPAMLFKSDVKSSLSIVLLTGMIPKQSNMNNSRDRMISHSKLAGS